jgi:hypothetical protein
MRRLFTLFVASAIALSVSAQTKTKPATAFKTGGVFTVMGGQSGTRNWTPAGSEKFSLTGAATLNLWANKSWGKNTWENNLDVSYALINTSTLGIRKIDDKIDLYSRYFRECKSPSFGFGIVSSLRTQITNAYDYEETPKKRISGFFAPAYVNFSPGVQMQSKNKSLVVHVGPAARFVVVTNSPYSLVNQGGIKPDGTNERTLANMYGVDPARQVRFETGLHLTAFFKKEILKNVNWKTRLEANQDILESTPGNVDIYWTNTINMSVNKWLQVNYNFDLYQDDNVRMFGPDKNLPAVQMKSLLGVGLAVKL